MTEQTAPAPTEPRRGFRLPSAYTILFALIVLTAIATWFVPAGTYQLDEDGAPIPGTYQSVDSKPARILVDSLTAVVRAANQTLPHSGKIIAAGLDATALHLGKELFSRARQTEVGSLTCVATRLTDTGSGIAGDRIMSILENTGGL